MASEQSQGSVPRILITGGTGFVGSHLVEALLAQPTSAHIHVTSFGSKTNMMPGGVEVHNLNLNDQAATFDLVKSLQPTQIYHLASYAAVSTSYGQALEVLHNNTDLQYNMLEAVRQFAPSARFLSVGSGDEYGVVQLEENQKITELFPLQPVNPYAVSKVTQELLAHSYFLSHKLQVIRTRSFNHTGERQAPLFVIPNFAQQIVAIERSQQDSIKVGNLDAIRDFTDVKDMVAAYILLMDRGTPGEVYNIGSGRGYKIGELLNQLCSLATIPITIKVDQDKLRPLDSPRLIADNEKIARLGWQPNITMEATLKRVLDYWREQS